ncbi:Ammonium transporter 1 [Elsinoe australis]|uniref:Ammonium transporter n=1 Tax=Elsinoe australis TaxID=40998 RepID=A0A2P8A4M0_9PEZI|nr:Ammonium transporter 1 [Elsinoe australis]
MAARGNTSTLPIQTQNFVPLIKYNGTTAAGGDSLRQNLNLYYESGDISWMLASTALVLIMTPRSWSALSLIWLSAMSLAVVSFQWFFWGFSLAFSHRASVFIGALDNIGFRNVLAQPSVGSDRIPDLIYAVYQGMFASLTVAIATGAVAERGRLVPCVIFMFVWTSLVYDPIACWTWNPAGWSCKLGGLDFAGGTPVHIASGFAALAYSFVLGPREGHGTAALNYRPHNVTFIVIGTVLLWFGWFGFNAGSALAANLRAVMAAMVTNLSASIGGITWCLIDFRLEKKWSVVGFCSGVIAGLVCITPGSGFVPPWSAVVYGVLAGAGCNYATKLKFYLQCDDALDIFAVHGVGGIIGNLLTGLFAADYIAHLDGSTIIQGGWVNQNYRQLGIQLADTVAGAAWSFVVTAIILYAMKLVGIYLPMFRLRASAEEEELGIDDVEIGEFAYDYVEVDRDIKAMSMDQEKEALLSGPQPAPPMQHQQPIMPPSIAPLGANPTGGPMNLPPGLTPAFTGGAGYV